MTGPLGEVQVGNVFVLVRDGYQYNTTFYSGICLMEDLRSTSPSSPQDAEKCPPASFSHRSDPQRTPEGTPPVSIRLRPCWTAFLSILFRVLCPFLDSAS